MKEIERKILDIDVQDVTEKLARLDAKKTFDGLVRVRYFDSNNAIRNKGDLLRVREFSDETGSGETEVKTEVVYKTNKRIENSCKIYDEYTLTGDNFDEAGSFFESLGYSVTCFYEKKRTTYKLENAEIVIDEYPEIPPFLEIEAKDAKTIDALVSQLGLQDHEASCETINEILARKYPEIDLNNLTFS